MGWRRSLEAKVQHPQLCRQERKERIQMAIQVFGECFGLNLAFTHEVSPDRLRLRHTV